MHHFKSKSVRCMLGSILVAGCLVVPNMAAAQQTDYTDPDNQWDDFGENEDPWEALNRKIFRFTDTVDRWPLKPIAKGYQKITPDVVEDGVHNFLRNLGETRNLANNLLQFKLRDAGVDTARFLFNTSFGLLGVLDVAT